MPTLTIRRIHFVLLVSTIDGALILRLVFFLFFFASAAAGLVRDTDSYLAQSNSGLNNL